MTCCEHSLVPFAFVVFLGFFSAPQQYLQKKKVSFVRNWFYIVYYSRLPSFRKACHQLEDFNLGTSSGFLARIVLTFPISTVFER